MKQLIAAVCLSASLALAHEPSLGPKQSLAPDARLAGDVTRNPPTAPAPALSYSELRDVDHQLLQERLLQIAILKHLLDHNHPVTWM